MLGKGEDKPRPYGLKTNGKRIKKENKNKWTSETNGNARKNKKRNIPIFYPKIVATFVPSEKKINQTAFSKELKQLKKS